MDIPGNRPEERFKCGPISATIWAQNRIVNGVEVKLHSMEIGM